MRKGLIAALTTVFIAVPPLGAESDTPPDAQYVAQAEQALNAVRTMKSHFIQVSSNGGQAEGDLYLSRPGKLRINYAPPTPMQLLVEGNFLVQVDTKLGTLTYIPLSRTPAGVLVKGNLTLGGDLKVTKVQSGAGLVRIAVVQRDKEDEGNIVLTFTENPFALRQWTVIDPQGIETRVTLVNPEVNMALDPHVFDFDASKFESNRLD
jgi:outer membrane lipoprotein-sorting protein